MSHRLRVVFLVGGESRSTRLSIEAVCKLPGLTPVATLVDTGRDTLQRRWKNLRRNLNRNGFGYLPHRVASALRELTDRAASRAVLDPHEVEHVLRTAFPDRARNLAELGTKYVFPVRSVGNLNSPDAIRALQQCDADLGIVLGTRILKPALFTVPRLGCINLHKGKVPEYRGMPPGFWELYDGVATAGVTVHFVDSKLDTGDIVETEDVPIHPLETPESLLEKLHMAGARALTRAVTAIQSETAVRTPQPQTATKPHNAPTLVQRAALQRKLRHWQQHSNGRVIVKNALYLLVFYCGLYALVRNLRKTSRAATLLYHRVNDFSKDVLTVDTETFAAHLLAIRKYYSTISSSELVRSIQQKRRIPPTAVVIHFDDCYRGVFTEGQPILQAAGVPATAFIASGFVGTERQFAHDRQKYPFRYDNATVSDLRAWMAAGFEIGAHTINHVDLGECGLENARLEISGSKTQLAEMLGTPVTLFSFPFGAITNIRPETQLIVRQAGYSALFSAHGGFAGTETSLWDMPRFGVSADHRPLWLLMEIEGLTLNAFAGALKKRAHPRQAQQRDQPARSMAATETQVGD